MTFFLICLLGTCAALSNKEIATIYLCGQIHGQEVTNSEISGRPNDRPELDFCKKYRETAIKEGANVLPRNEQ